MLSVSYLQPKSWVLLIFAAMTNYPLIAKEKLYSKGNVLHLFQLSSHLSFVISPCHQYLVAWLNVGYFLQATLASIKGISLLFFWPRYIEMCYILVSVSHPSRYILLIYFQWRYFSKHLLPAVGNKEEKKSSFLLFTYLKYGKKTKFLFKKQLKNNKSK